jgi:hypothetical protein
MTPHKKNRKTAKKNPHKTHKKLKKPTKNR